MKVVCAGLLGACRHEILAVCVSEPGNDVAWQCGRGSQGGREFVGAQRVPAFGQGAGLQLLDNPVSALLDLQVRAGASTRRPETAVRISIPRRGVVLQRAPLPGGIPGTCVWRPGEQGQCLTHRVKRPGSLAAEPVVPRHGIGMQRTQMLLALARRGRGGGVRIGVRRGRTWKVTCPLALTAVFGPNVPVFQACAIDAVARSALSGSLIWAVTATVAKVTVLRAGGGDRDGLRLVAVGVVHGHRIAAGREGNAGRAIWASRGVGDRAAGGAEAARGTGDRVAVGVAKRGRGPACGNHLVADAHGGGDLPGVVGRAAARGRVVDPGVGDRDRRIGRHPRDGESDVAHPGDGAVV